MQLYDALVVLQIIVILTTIFSFSQQFLTFENGKFGVNFGGYHAEAGLGGLLTGNAAHGGLSASAGTPYGQQAGAGLGGGVDGHGNSIEGFLAAFAKNGK